MSTNCNRACAYACARGLARSRAHTQNITPPQPLTVERRRGRTAGSIRIDTSTYYEPSVFEQNDGYIRVGAGAVAVAVAQ